MRRTRLRVDLLGLFALLCTFFGSGDPASAAGKGRICFVRGNEPESMKLPPVRVLGEMGGRSKKLVELKGADKACVNVPFGKWSFEARSKPPYDRKATDLDACRSFPLVLEVTKPDAVTVTVAPLGHAPLYICGWELN
jgi:hypothetical protein